MITLTEADLSGYTGSETIFCHPLFPCWYTEGVRAVMERGEAHWLIDAIFSYRFHPVVRTMPFQIWTLTKAGTSAVLEVADDDGRVVERQRFAYTDFPLDKITFWFLQDTLILPSEY